jgi:hypothetical protein
MIHVMMMPTTKLCTLVLVEFGRRLQAKQFRRTKNKRDRTKSYNESSHSTGSFRNIARMAKTNKITVMPKLW